MRPTWPTWAMGIAEAASMRSEDPYRQVGACLLREDWSVASVGYNGALPGVEIDWSDRDSRRAQVLHAEANALRYVQPGEPRFLATTSLPCEACMLSLASYGVREVFYRDELDPVIYDRDRILAVAQTAGIVVTNQKGVSWAAG